MNLKDFASLELEHFEPNTDFMDRHYLITGEVSIGTLILFILINSMTLKHIALNNK